MDQVQDFFHQFLLLLEAIDKNINKTQLSIIPAIKDTVTMKALAEIAAEYDLVFAGAF